MTVFKHRGAWRAEVYLDGKRIATKSGFKLKRTADDWHADTLAMFKRDGAPTKATIEELMTRFKEWHIPTKRPATQQKYELELRSRIGPFFRFRRLTDITPGMLEAFKVKVGQELMPRPANNCLGVLNTMLNKGVKWGMLNRNPYCLDPFPVEKKPYEWWSERDQIERFVSSARKSWYFGVYLTALETGMRLGEIIGLSKADIDLETGTIHVHRQWLQEIQEYGPPKHGLPRWIDFDPKGELAQILRRAIERSPHPEGIFLTRRGHRPFRAGVAYKYFHPILERAKLPRMSFHGLRHSFASWYMIHHDNIWDLKAILGHADIKTTMRYAHHSRRARREVLTAAQIITHNSLTEVSRTTS